MSEKGIWGGFSTEFQLLLHRKPNPAVLHHNIQKRSPHQSEPADFSPKLKQGRVVGAAAGLRGFDRGGAFCRWVWDGHGDALGRHGISKKL